jgi:hypothetical protein
LSKKLEKLSLKSGTKVGHRFLKKTFGKVYGKGAKKVFKTESKLWENVL